MSVQFKKLGDGHGVDNRLTRYTNSLLFSRGIGAAGKIIIKLDKAPQIIR